MASSASWVVPSSADVTGLLSSLVQAAVANDPNGSSRLAKNMTLAIEAVRAAIQVGNRNALSLTSGTVPPSARVHTLMLAIGMSLNSTPNMDFALKEQLKGDVEAAKEWLEEVRYGKQSVEQPFDPDQSTIPLVKGWGGEPVVDMATDGSQTVYYVPPLTVTSAAPTNLRATAGKSRILLEWDRPNIAEQAPVRYTVYRRDGSGTATAAVIASGLVQQEFADASVTAGVSYYYYVTASTTAGVSTASNQVECVPK